MSTSASDTKNLFTRTLLITFVSLGGILFGYDTGVISGVISNPNFLVTFGHYTETIQAYELLTSHKSLIVSILSAGTFVGALLAAPMADAVGRRYAITASCVVFIIGICLQMLASYECFLAGRVLAGLGVGLTSVIGPCYQSETSPKSLRGLLVGGYEGCVTVGLLLAAVVNQASLSYTGNKSWRIPIAVQFAWGVIFGAGILALLESPRWLMRRGDRQRASAALCRLSGFNNEDPRVDMELDSIQASLHAEGNSGYASLFQKGQESQILRRTLTSGGLSALQQLCGINFIFYYGTSFFMNAGIKNSFVINIIVNVVNVIMTIPGLWAIDTLGRRIILLWGAAVMALTQLLVAIVGVTISTENVVGQRVLIALVCFYIAGFASSWGPGLWTITAEIFPLRNRAKGMSLSTAVFWFFNFLLGFVTPYLVDSGPGNAGLGVKVFFIWGGFSVLCYVFVYFFIPETMRRSLEQVDLLWRTSTVHGSLQRRKDIIEEASDINRAGEVSPLPEKLEGDVNVVEVV